LHPDGYHSYWHSAEKPGYSGVAIYSKKDPLTVIEGIGVPDIDREGRVITAEFKDFFYVNAYFPNSQPEGVRIKYKLHFCQEILKFLKTLEKKKKGVVLCGDYNIAHTEIDLANPKQNEKNPGYLPEEREWMSSFLKKGYVDVYREFVKEGGHYTWWTYRFGARQRNIGWRIDYHTVNQDFLDQVKGAEIHPSVMGSDHCPVELVLKG